MSLLSLQRTMARAVMQPLTHTERMSRLAPTGKSMAKHAAGFIKPNDRLTSFERLEIYHRQYWFRLQAGLMEDFPGLEAILGSGRFEKLCIAYLTDRPSRSFTLRNLGRGLEAWLLKHPRWAGSRQAMALDMVRLEWADIEAFDGTAEAPLDTETVVGAAGADLKLRLQPYVRLLKLSYPVDDLVLKIKSLNEDTDFSSNAFRERRKRKHVQTIAKLMPAQICLAVHRVNYSVYFRRLDVSEFRLLHAMQSGKTLGQAVSCSFGKRRNGSQPELAQIATWFQNWAKLGWFCSGEGKQPRR